MTRLYISADLEGASWVSSFKQCYPDSGDFDAYRHAVGVLAEEVSVVCEAAFEAGATDIVVNDAHGIMSNLRQSQLPDRVQLLSGKPKNCAMSSGLDNTFDAMFLIGYHAKAGTDKGVLCHTFHDKIFNVTINGVSYGEGGINALYASLVHNVPVVLASGDQALGAELTSLIPGVELVQTKVGITTTAAQNRPRSVVLEEYRAKTRQVLANQKAWRENILKLSGPYEIYITFINTVAADVAMTIPGFVRMDGCTIGWKSGTEGASEFESLYRMLQASYALQAYTAIVEH